MDNAQNGKAPVVAYLLWFFLGGFGAHRFYFGKTGSAIGMLALNIASAVLSVIAIGLLGYLALFAWWVVDAFLIGKWLKGDDASSSGYGEPPMSQAA